MKDEPTIFYPRLEALRGFAALTVAAFHSWQSSWIDTAGHTRNFLSSAATDSWPERLGLECLRILGGGYAAVILFFVLSGFVLSGSLTRGPQAPVAAAQRFIIARLFRIYPAVFATIAIFAILFWLTGKVLGAAESYGPLGILRNALLLDTSIDGVMWTLQIELVAVPLIFLVFVGFVRWGIALPITVFAVLMVLSFSGRWNRLLNDLPFFGSILAFIPGMVVFLTAGRVIRQLPTHLAPAAFIAALVGFLMSGPVLGMASHWAMLAEALLGGYVVAFAAFGQIGVAGRILDSRVARFFGRISFSFYLLHPLTLIVMWNMPHLLGSVIRAGIPPVAVGLALFALSTAAITPLAWAMYRWVEQPGVAAGRLLASHLAVRYRAAAPAKAG